MSYRAAKALSGNSNWYRNFKHYGAPGEETCYLPGLCMNPKLAGAKMVGVGGLGCDCSQKPMNGLGYTMTVGTPVGDQSFSIPLEQMAKDAANIGINAIKKPLIDMATDALVNKFWPALQPKVQQQGDEFLAEAKAEVRRDLTLTIGVLSLVILGGFVISGRRKAKAA